MYQFIEVAKNLKKDPLSDFINDITFIPHAFGYQCNNPAAICDNRITGDFELIYFTGGEGNITIDNRVYTCKAGDAVLIPPFTLHKIQTPASNPHENYWIHFDVYPFHLQKQFVSALLGNDGYILHPGLTEELTQLYRMLARELESDSAGRMHFVSTLLVLVIIEILRLKKSQPFIGSSITSTHPAETEIVRKSLDYIQDNIFNRIDLAILVNHLHISESYLFKSFSVILEMPPNHFIQLVKIKKAEQLLKSTHHTIKEISEMLGFSSPFYFSNVYKKFYTVSPREYIRALNNS